MSYPTPTIYTYRVRGFNPVNHANGQNSFYLAEFSTNSGTSWLQLFGRPFGSKSEAFQAIATIVNNETKFRKQYLQAIKFENPKLVPTATTFAYPPA